MATRYMHGLASAAQARGARILLQAALGIAFGAVLGMAHAGSEGVLASLQPAPTPGAPWGIGMPAPSPDAPVAPALPQGPQTLATLSVHALMNHPATRAAWAGALADLAAVGAARALFAPVVDLKAPLSISRDPAAAAPSVARSLSATLGLSWVLFDSGSRAAGLESARWQAAASQLARNRELQRVVSAVEQAGYAYLGARQLTVALQSSVDAAQASLSVVQARRRSGLATVGESAQAEAALADAQVQLIQAQAQARSAAGSLAQAVGVPVGIPIDLIDDVDGPSSEADAAPLADVDRLMARARSSRSDLGALDAQVLQGRARVAAAQAAGRPSLSLGVQAARQWNHPASTHSTQQIGITLSVPLFDGGLVRAQTAAARAQLEQLVALREEQAQAIDLEVWQSFQEADSAGAVIAGARSVLQSAAVAESAARERYRTGVGSLLELIMAQRTSAQARVGLVQARYTARLAVAKLGYVVGAASVSALR